MTIRSVREAIQQATTNDPPDCFTGARVDAAEARSIVRAAGPKVSAGEQKLITDLFDRGVRTPGANEMVTMACPEHPGGVSFDEGATRTFRAFFAKHDIPRGDVLKGKIEEIIDNFGYGPKLSSAPNFSARPVHIQIRDNRPADGDLLEAYLDAARNQFYIKSTGSGFGGPETIGPTWFGPTSVHAGLSAKKRQDITSVLQKAEAAGLLEWRPMQLPLGTQFYRAELYREKHPDGFAFSALIPVGALAPDAPRQDPDKADNFIAVRQGGFAGMTWMAGPLQLGQGHAA